MYMPNDHHSDPQPLAVPLHAPLRRLQSITKADLAFLARHWIRSVDFLQLSRPLVQVNYFAPGEEAHFAMLWRVLCELHDDRVGINWLSVRRRLLSRLAIDPGYIDLAQRNELLAQNDHGIVWSATHATSDLSLDSARMALEEFLVERRVLPPIRRELFDGRGTPATDHVERVLDAAASDLRRIRVGRLLAAARLKMTKPPRFIPSGLDFIDRFIHGQQPGHCYGLLGAIGSGRTTLAIQMATSMSRYFFEAELAGAPRRLAVLVTYQESAEQLNHLVWSSAAQVPLEKLEQLASVGWDCLTTWEQLSTFDHTVAAESRDGAVRSECERWDGARDQLTSSFVLLDFSGGRQFPYAGAEWVPELEAMLARLAAERCARIGWVGIDCASNMVGRWIETVGWEGNAQQRHLLATLGEVMRRKVAVPHDAPVWLFHLLAPAATEIATMPVSHLRAAEARGFAASLTACGCLGGVDVATDCRLLHWSKVRHKAAHGHSTAILRRHAFLPQLVDVSDVMTIDLREKAFRRRSPN